MLSFATGNPNTLVAFLASTSHRLGVSHDILNKTTADEAEKEIVKTFSLLAKNDSKRLSRWVCSHCVNGVNSSHIKRVNKIHQNRFTHTAKTDTERSFTHTVSTGSPRTPYTSTRCYLFWYRKELTESLTKKNGKYGHIPQESKNYHVR